VISINLFVTVWSASSLQATIIGCLNKIYGVAESRPYWRVRLQSAYMTFVQLAVLLAAIVAFMESPTMLSFLHIDSVSDSVADALKWFIVFVVLLFSFGFTFHMGPDVQSKKWVTPGSVFGAASFVFMAWALRYYFTYWARFDVVYGPMFMVVAPLFWLWMNCLVLLVAAEINRIVQFTADNRHLPRPCCPDHDCKDHPAETEPETGDTQKVKRVKPETVEPDKKASEEKGQTPATQPPETQDSKPVSTEPEKKPEDIEKAPRSE
jgi:uncharacterized BrkB/YihY/UPF0761 family membrane protein